MALKADEVYEAGLELDVDERTVVAHRLLASLHPDDDAEQPAVDAAWRDEFRHRIDDTESGKVELVDGRETIAMARAMLAERRG